MNRLVGTSNMEFEAPLMPPPQPSDAPAIAFDQLRVIYPAKRKGEPPKLAVNGLTLAVEQGEVFGFLGPNGAGKTTTMNVLLGFVRPASGSARIYGRDAADPRAREVLGYLPELTYYYKFLTARELLRFYARLFSLPPAQTEKRLESLLALVELTEAADRPIRTYSKGMQQRAGLAQALLNDPMLLVLDEPTSGLDPLGRMKVRRIIERLKNEGKTVFFSSHELSEAEKVCDRVAILHDGEVKEMGVVGDLLEDYQLSLEEIFLKVIGLEEELK